ncbi:MAG TPA: PLP-dependent aspartate aminotransferase family protein [Anaerolineales bacterium]|nr:PLP-dependent aspartate aminotransferase family protein [Anaerolineales bacterium]
MKDLAQKSFQTRAVHAGERVPPAGYRPVATPIWPSVGYLYENMDDLDAVFAHTKSGQIYLRYSNPTVEAFEAAVANLEQAEAAQAYGSGMAAIHAALLAAGIKAGTSVVAALDVYGATFTLLNNLLTSLNVNVRMVDVTNHAEVEAAVKDAGASVLYLETISNPLLKVADIPALADLAHRHGASFLVDSTFASPYLINPIKHGADFVIHSATKYLSGHGDVLAGVIATSQANKNKMFELNKLVGAVLGPFEGWLALRGLKTLPLRMKQQCESALQVATWLETHPRVKKVNYPGLKSHAQYSLANRLFDRKGCGGVLSFEIAGADKAKIFRFMESLSICLPATTLGDIYSLVLHPASSSHRTLTAEERARVGISDGLVRLSMGIESVDDILSDLETGLSKI